MISFPRSVFKYSPVLFWRKKITVWLIKTNNSEIKITIVLDSVFWFKLRLKVPFWATHGCDPLAQSPSCPQSREKKKIVCPPSTGPWPRKTKIYKAAKATGVKTVCNYIWGLSSIMTPKERSRWMIKSQSGCHRVRWFLKSCTENSKINFATNDALSEIAVVKFL